LRLNQKKRYAYDPGEQNKNGHEIDIQQQQSVNLLFGSKNGTSQNIKNMLEETLHMPLGPSVSLAPIGAPAFNSLFITFSLVHIANSITCQINSKGQIRVLSQDRLVPSAKTFEQAASYAANCAAK
jgi:hypothetical protein